MQPRAEAVPLARPVKHDALPVGREIGHAEPVPVVRDQRIDPQPAVPGVDALEPRQHEIAEGGVVIVLPALDDALSGIPAGRQ